jgi:hypothetical protein
MHEFPGTGVARIFCRDCQTTGWRKGTSGCCSRGGHSADLRSPPTTTRLKSSVVIRRREFVTRDPWCADQRRRCMPDWRTSELGTTRGGKRQGTNEDFRRRSREAGGRYASNSGSLPERDGATRLSKAGSKRTRPTYSMVVIRRSRSGNAGRRTTSGQLCTPARRATVHALVARPAANHERPARRARRCIFLRLNSREFGRLCGFRGCHGTGRSGGLQASR